MIVDSDTQHRRGICRDADTEPLRDVIAREPGTNHVVIALLRERSLRDTQLRHPFFIT